jgi:uncharacterized protein (DUF1800 family)
MNIPDRKLVRQAYAYMLLLLMSSQILANVGPTSKGGREPKGITKSSALPTPTLEDRIRFQEQAAFGYKASLDTTIVNVGFDQWINDQAAIGTTPQSVPTTPTTPFPDDPTNFPFRPISPRPTCDGYSVAPEVADTPSNCFRDSYTLYPLQKWFIQDALYGNDQLRNKVAWALSQIWVTSGLEIKHSRQMAEYYKILYKYALGDNNSATFDYLELMKEMTSNPAMGEYLDMAYSSKGFANENYPRELLQLFTTGVYLLNPGGSYQCINNDPKCENSNTPAPVYTQDTVNNFAKVFTGWTFCNNGAVAQCSHNKLGTVNYQDPMLLNLAVPTVMENRHDLTAKALLSYTGSTTTNVAACDPSTTCSTLAGIATYANNSRTQALENIFYHPNTPVFVSKLLIQHLVTSNPRPKFVSQVAEVFADNGSGQRGDMKAVIKAILLSDDARGVTPVADQTYGKLREPVQFATNILRALKVKGQGTAAESDGVIFRDEYFDRMGQKPFYAPSVFNYYSPKNTIIFAGGSNLLAPEFGLFTPTTAVARANFAKTLVYGGISVNMPDVTVGTALDISDLIVLAGNDWTGDQLVNELNTRLLHGGMSVSTQTTIKSAVSLLGPNNNTAKAQAAVYLTITSAEFQVQR